MPYRYIENIATADVALEIWADTIELLFKDAADAVLNVMVENPDSIKHSELFSLNIDDISIEMLLFSVLQELIFIKDTKGLLCRISDLSIGYTENMVHFRGIVFGEPVSPAHHKLLVDVKAVTLHRYFVKKEDNLWKAQIILDI